MSESTAPMPFDAPVVAGPSRRARRPSTTVAALAFGVLAGTSYVASTPLKGAPALGAFLDPVHGVWGVAAQAELPSHESMSMAALHAPVEVRFDDRAVPHIFAASQEDAWRALGYVHARDRLFEMEVQTRAVAGTLSELIGPRTREADREALAQGLAWGATRAFAAMDTSSPAIRATRAYAEGVNSFIDALTPAQYPLEFHLLGTKPMRWEPKYSAYLLARMGLTLAYTDGELRRAQVEAVSYFHRCGSQNLL